jgi:hypothetical protein
MGNWRAWLIDATRWMASTHRLKCGSQLLRMAFTPTSQGKMKTQMRNFTKAALAATSAIVLFLIGCTGGSGVGPVPVSSPSRSQASVVFVTNLTPIEFSFPAGWYSNSGEHPFDLQCYSPGAEVNTAVFVFKKTDLEPDATPLSTFWDQVNDIKSKRSNFKELSPIQKREDEAKTITSIEYSGDKNSARNCYRFSLIEFKSDDTRFAVAMQSAVPEDWERSKPVFQEIIQSARAVPAKD